MPLSVGMVERALREHYEPGLREGLLGGLVIRWMWAGIPGARVAAARAAFARLSTPELLDVMMVWNERMMSAISARMVDEAL